MRRAMRVASEPGVMATSSVGWSSPIASIRPAESKRLRPERRSGRTRSTKSRGANQRPVGANAGTPQQPGGLVDVHEAAPGLKPDRAVVEPKPGRPVAAPGPQRGPEAARKLVERDHLDPVEPAHRHHPGLALPDDLQVARGLRRLDEAGGNRSERREEGDDPPRPTGAREEAGPVQG